MTIPRWGYYIAGAVICLVIGLAVRSHWTNKAAVAEVKQSEQHEEAGKISSTLSAKEEGQATALDSSINAKSNTIESLKAEILRLRRLQAENPSSSADHNGTASVAQDGMTSSKLQTAVVATRDKLIEAQDEKISLLEVQVSDLKSALDDSKKAVASYKEAGSDLHRAVDLYQGNMKSWAISGGYGTNQTAELGVDRTWGPIRLGVDIIRHPAGNSVMSTDLLARVSICF